MWGRLVSWLGSLGGLIGRSRAERDLDDEAAFHLQARTDHWRQRGLPDDEAARRARIEFGGLERYKDIGREIKGFRFFDDLRADLRYGWRQLLATPTLTSVAVAILAIGIGANTAVFSVLEAMLWRPLPVERPHELREIVRQMRSSKGVDFVAATFAYPVFAEIRDRSRSFSDVVLFDRHDQLNVGIEGRASPAQGLATSGSFLRGLGVRLTLGRAFTPDDDRLDAPAVAVLTHRGWRRLFGEDPSAIGARITLNGAPTTIVGVTHRAFDGVEPGRPVDIVAPLLPLGRAFYPDGRPFTDVRRPQYRLMARLAMGVNEDRARDETIALSRDGMTRGGVSGGVSMFATLVLRNGSQGIDTLRAEYGPQLRLLMGIAAAILFIACANVAGLLVTRADGRRREMTVRLALGAGRGRLVRQTLTESLLLSALGATAGVGLALALRDRLLPLLNQAPTPVDLAIGVSPRFLAFSLAVCVAVGLACGLLPAVRLARRDARPSLTRSVGRTATDAPRLFAGKTLIALQLALSIVLLTGAGLMARTLVNLRAQPLGFVSARLALFTLHPAISSYEGVRLLDFYDRVQEAIAAVSGVQSASFSRYPLLTGQAYQIVSEPGGGEFVEHSNVVGPGYFDTMGIPLVAGRDFTSADREAAPEVAIVNEAYARAAGGVAVGTRIAHSSRARANTTIVGIAADARYTNARAAAPPTIYLPVRQRPSPQMTFAVRTAGDPAAWLPSLREAVADLDPLTPPFDMTTQAELNERSWRKERIFAGVTASAALLAVLLACLGIYGTLSYSVARRTPEIGVRVALGAHPRDVVTLIARESLRPVIAGALAGLVGAFAATRLIESMLFGVTRVDAPTFIAAAAVIGISAALATWLPARRASRVDPLIALRHD